MLVPVIWFTVKCQCFGIRCNIAERFGSRNCIVLFFRSMIRCDVFNTTLFLSLWLEWLQNKYIKLMFCPRQSPRVLWVKGRNEKNQTAELEFGFVSFNYAQKPLRMVWTHHHLPATGQIIEIASEKKNHFNFQKNC